MSGDDCFFRLEPCVRGRIAKKDLMESSMCAVLALVTSYDMRVALLHCLREDGHRSELELLEQKSLSRDGAARTLGLTPLATALEVVMPYKQGVVR